MMRFNRCCDELPVSEEIELSAPTNRRPMLLREVEARQKNRLRDELPRCSIGLHRCYFQR